MNVNLCVYKVLAYMHLVCMRVPANNYVHTCKEIQIIGLLCIVLFYMRE